MQRKSRVIDADPAVLPEPEPSNHHKRPKATTKPISSMFVVVILIIFLAAVYLIKGDEYISDSNVDGSESQLRSPATSTAVHNPLPPETQQQQQQVNHVIRR